MREVLRSPGEPLDDETLAFMEPRFGHDFSHVRVHANARATESARRVNASAYTVGANVIFAHGQYAPHTHEGRKLLGHELTHVIQQTGRLQRNSITAEPTLQIGPDDDSLENEAHEAARKIAEDDGVPRLGRTGSARLQRQRVAGHQPAIIGLDEAGPKAQLVGGEKEAELAQCIKTLGPDPEECEPSAALTWADFQGAPDAGSPFGAVTSSSVNPVDVPTQVCAERVLGKAASPTRRFRAKLNSTSSWVLDDVANAGDPAKNGCAPLVAQCVSYFKSGGSKPWGLRPTGNCAASVPFRGDKAMSAAECATKVSADCNDRKVGEALRLLKHEQNHFNISCVFAKKANAALAQGGLERPIHQAVIDKRAPTQTLYDSETQHGCVAASQAAWETNIAAGLPDITIP
ncbi:MAG TPA: DUF4157 domain-containing protein [Chthoniobacterales bacterium]|nr:DUF4157 domain-containing protein [Chthoniobacterales bacterium]